MQEYDQSSMAPPPPQRGWFARNWLWFIPLTLFVLFLMCAGACTGLLGVGYFALYNSDPYRLALEAVQKDPRVKAQLGDPIDGVSWPPPGGKIDIQNDRGEANLTFHVQGPKGQASVQSQSRMIGGKWGLVAATVVFGDGQRIVVDTSDAGDGDAPPKWDAPEADVGNLPGKTPNKGSTPEPGKSGSKGINKLPSVNQPGKAPAKETP